jgi:hypothetical protein
MNMFNRKAPDVGATETLRRHLRARVSRPGGVALANVARDLNDGLAADVNRRTAREVATRMAGDGASEAVIRDLAKGLISSLPDRVGPGLSERELRAFMDDGKDIAVEFKQQLALYFYPGPIVYDANDDRLVRPELMKLPTPVPPEPWRNPDPRIAAAQEALRAAYAAAQPPRPAPKMPPGSESGGRIPKKAGFTA